MVSSVGAVELKKTISDLEMLDLEEEESKGDEQEEEVPKVVLMGQDRDSKERSSDVIVFGKDDNIDFSDMQLSEDIQKGLRLCRFEKPTPIQLSAIPLGKLKKDLLLQAKSGTGKTCVFSVCILQQVEVTEKCIQGLVISPCREVTVQIANVLKSIGAFMDGLKIKVFIGGTSVPQSVRRSTKCHIAVGCPGRLAHMVKDYEMDLSQVRVIALDEADKLMEPSFFSDVQVILNALPKNRQIIATSATYSETILTFLEKFMKSPQIIKLDSDNPSLCAVDQYILDVKKILGMGKGSRKTGKTSTENSTDVYFKAKFDCLKEVLNRVPYTQVMVFSNYILRAESIYEKLKDLDLDVDLLSAGRSQEDRLTAFTLLQQGKIRIMVATDVASRGIDIEGIDLVVNFDIPYDSSTYIHRVGRTGRFGAFGKALSLCFTDSEKQKLSEHQLELKFNIFLIDKIEELITIETSSNSLSNVQKYRQLRGMKEPITLQDPENKNWKEVFTACMTQENPHQFLEFSTRFGFKSGITSEAISLVISEAEAGYEKKRIEKERMTGSNLVGEVPSKMEAGGFSSSEEENTEDDENEDW